jgi:hypothetical protein
MPTINQDILKAVQGDKKKAKSIKIRNHKEESVELRYKVFLSLHKKGYSIAAIAMATNSSKATVWRGLRHSIGNKGLKRDKELTSDIIDRITNGGNRMHKGALYTVLMSEGFLRNTIADYFDVPLNTIKSDTCHYRKYLDLLKFQELRKKIVKF